MKKTIVAMLLAGGQGSRLGVLTSNMAKPAVPFGGKYRIIDFPLSNCVNSGIDTVGVLTQYRPLALNSYLGTGQYWDLDRLNGGVFVLPPYMTADDGTADLGEPDHVYRCRVDLSRTAWPVLPERTLDDVTLQGEVEGISFDRETGRMFVSYNRGAQIVLGMPKGFYDGYDHEISEVFAYDMAARS